MATKPVMFRFPEELIARLVQQVAREMKKNPGFRLTRSDVVRRFLEIMLKEEEDNASEGTMEPDPEWEADDDDDDDDDISEDDPAYWGLGSESEAAPTPAKKKPSRTRRSRVKK